MVASLSEHQKTFRDLAITHIKKHGCLRIIAIAGPNGAGKTTLIEALIKKFPKIFTEVVQVGTRPSRENEGARRFISCDKFLKEKIVVDGSAGLYCYGYTLKDLMSSMKKNKILLFEGLTRLKKLQKILGKKYIQSMIVGVLPPGETCSDMKKELQKRLKKRTGYICADMKKKLIDAEQRLIPEVFKKAHIIIRTVGNKTLSDIEDILTSWNTLYK